MFVLLAVAGAAHAQVASDWILDTTTPVLEPDTTGAFPWMENSVGSPSIAYDFLRDRFLMVFESRILDPVDGALVGCPQGVWGLGLATSPDAVTWTVDPTPLIEPVPGDGTHFSCVAAHPTILYETPPQDPDGTIVVWFKGEQDEGVQALCGLPTEPRWGCEQYTGIGRMRVPLFPDGTVHSTRIRRNPVIDAGTFPSIGYPKVFDDGGIYNLLLTMYPDIWATSGQTHNNFAPPTDVMEVVDYQGAITWVRDEFFNPATVCDDSATFPLASFVGGRDTNFGAVLSGGWGKAISTTGSSWVLGVDAQQEWFDDDSWRHWDIMRLTTGDYLVWFSQADAGTVPKVNRIYFGGTTLTFNNTDVQSKSCP